MPTQRDTREKLLQARDDAKANLFGAQSEAMKAKIELENSDIYKAYVKLQEQVNTQTEAVAQAEQSVMHWMLDANVKSIDFGDKKITVKENAGSLIVENEDIIPQKYIRQKIVNSVDKIWIKEALKNGEEVAGVKLEPSYTLLVTERPIVPTI